jgi:diaminopimelate decarboxylase
MTTTARLLSDDLASQLLGEFGSPLYVYDETTLRTRLRELAGLVRHRPFHASISVKANGNPHLLAVARQEGLRGDAMSPGEILLLERAGFSSEQIFFIPNNVSDDEFRFAHQRGILTSLDSIDQLASWARLFPGSRVALRVNPGIGDGHHEKVVTAGSRTKFGILPGELDQARRILTESGIKLAGLNQHIGSGFLEPSRYLQAAAALLAIAEGFPELEFVDFGGGFGIPYHEDSNRLDLSEFGQKLDALLSDWTSRTGRTIEVGIEPGRYWCAECGILLGIVHAVKPRGEGAIAGTDLGFNVLQRPAMYDSFHQIDLVAAPDSETRETIPVTWVGNICESGDILGSERLGPLPRIGDAVRVRDAGAYGWAMSSSYNARPRAAEVLVESNGNFRLIRHRETWEDLMRRIA